MVWNSALDRPDRFRAVAGLSVPFTGVPDKPFTDVFKRAFTDKGRFFYQAWFQQVGPPEAEIEAELSGIPQAGMVLGSPRAEAKLIEFGDLQCPVCKGFAEEILPPIIEGRVRNGEARLEFRNFVILGEESATAGAAAVAAGLQGRGWNFVELF